MLREYKIQNRATKERQVVVAETFADACKEMGWNVSETYVGNPYLGMDDFIYNLQKYNSDPKE